MKGRAVKPKLLQDAQTTKAVLAEWRGAGLAQKGRQARARAANRVRWSHQSLRKRRPLQICMAPCACSQRDTKSSVLSPRPSFFADCVGIVDCSLHHLSLHSQMLRGVCYFKVCRSGVNPAPWTPRKACSIMSETIVYLLFEIVIFLTKSGKFETLNIVIEIRPPYLI